MKKEITLVSTYGLARPGFLPLSVLSLATSLQKSGYLADIRDYQFFSNNVDPFPQNFVDFLDDSRDIIGISVLCGTMPLAILAAQAIKEKWPEKVIILGGPGPSPVAKSVLQQFPFIDIVIRDEGEETIIQTMNCLTSSLNNELSEVKGISFRHKDKIICNEEQARIQDLDSLKLDYSLMNLDQYTLFSILTSRGCQYKCMFCASAPFWKNKVVERSIPSILDEVELLVKEYGIQVFGILDDTFTSSPGRVHEFCRGLLQRDINVSWHCTCRTDLAREDMFMEMSRAGCTRVVMGIESVVPDILGKIEKMTTPDQAIEAVEFALRCNLGPVLSFVWGWPFESLNEFYRTILFADHLASLDPRISIKLNLLSPYLPSKLAEQYRNSYVPAFDDITTKSRLGKCVPNIPANRELFSDLVKNHPDIFVAFCRFDTPAYETKATFVRSYSDKLGQGLLSTLMGEFS